MELLLWLYLYDNRWFFKKNISIDLYKFLLLIPLSAHFLDSVISLHDMYAPCVCNCKEERNKMLYHQIIISIICCLIIAVFLKQISYEYKKESLHVELGKKAYPTLKLKIHEHDFWIRRNSLSSLPGLMLLIEGIFSFFWSYLQVYTIRTFTICDSYLTIFIYAHGYITFLSCIFIFIVFGLLIAIKVVFVILGQFFPKALIKIADLYHRPSSNIIIHHPRTD